MTNQTVFADHMREENRWHFEKAQLLDQVAMLEAEVDRQSTIIDALVKAIRVIER